MPESNATILIPDISGYTEFITTTELDHSSHAINLLLDSIVNAVGEEYEISEIEGDAVLMFKRGDAPAKKEILDICLKIFNAFHYKRKWMEQHTICPCGACQSIINLTLKFIVHHGPVGQITVGRFVKLSGTEVIVAHRLLKNSVPSNEYLLVTDKLWQHLPDSAERFDMDWSNLSDEFASLGKLDYHFAKLDIARKRSPDPPPVENYHATDDISFLEISIAANYRDVYMLVMNIPGRSNWVPGLQKVEQDVPGAFIGSVHHCTFENFRADISPTKMQVSEEGILFAERFNSIEMGIALIYEYVFKNTGDNNCFFACRILSNSERPVPDAMNTMLFDGMKKMGEKLKTIFETTGEPSS